MKSFVVLLTMLSCTVLSFSQGDSLAVDEKEPNRFGVCLIPSVAPNVYGVAIGLVGSEVICNKPYTKISHGINFQLIGQGFLQLLYVKGFRFKDFRDKDSVSLAEKRPKRAIHNGLLLSPFGTFTDQVNGVSLSLWMSMGSKINGVSFNLLWNLYKQINGVSIGFVNHSLSTKGMQIGIVNKTKKLTGVQLGLWNKNEKRSLPLINWNF
jgi:hypothetical protein